MFACIYSRSVPNSQQKAANAAETTPSLVDLAFTFSPLVELTSADTVVLDVSGQDLLFGSSAVDAPLDTECARNLAAEVIRQAKAAGLKVSVAVAANVDVAIHAARLIKGLTILPPGNELLITRNFSDRKSTRLNSSHSSISYAVFCLKKKKTEEQTTY